MNHTTWAHLTPISANAKTGPIPVSTTESRSCPPSCPLRSRGCYAEGGPLGLHWRAVSLRQRGMPWGEFCAAVASLPADTLWRHNQSGDLPGPGESVNRTELEQLVRANAGKRGFTYTHKHNVAALEAVRWANGEGFTVNLSANTLAHADQLADTGAGPVVVVLPSDQTRNTHTPAGRRVVVCPATQREGVTCATCKLCAWSGRKVVVGFPAHGARKAVASQMAGGVA